MSFTKFDHIAIVVADLDAAVDHFRELLEFRDEDLIYERDYDDVDPDTKEVDVMHFALFPVGESYIELIEPVSEGPMKKFLDRTGGGIHHIGLTTNDLRKEWQRMAPKSDKFGIIGDRPRVDQYDVSYWFLHPKKNHGALFEIDAHWVKTSVSDMTPVEKTPQWNDEDMGSGN